MSTKASMQEEVAALKGVPALLRLVILLIAVVCFIGWKWETYEREKLERELNKLNAEMELMLSERQDIAAQERQKCERTLGELNVEITRKQSKLQNNAFQEKQKLERTLDELNMELKLQQSGPQLTYSQVILMILAAVVSVVGIGYVIAKRVWEIELKVRQKNDKETKKCSQPSEPSIGGMMEHDQHNPWAIPGWSNDVKSPNQWWFDQPSTAWKEFIGFH